MVGLKGITRFYVTLCGAGGSLWLHDGKETTVALSCTLIGMVGGASVLDGVGPIDGPPDSKDIWEGSDW